MKINKLIFARVTKSISLVLMGGVTLSLLACSATQKAPITRAEAHCGLLGRFCDRLTPGTEDQLGLRYVRPGVDWRKYKAVLIEPVTFWGDEEGGASAEVRQELVNEFESVLKQEFGKKFQIVTRPGPGVMTLAVGMTKAESATPVLRSISMIVPQARALSTGAYLVTGQFPFVGTAQVEGKVEDSVSGQVLAAIVDKRLGGGSPTAGFQWQWGDVENAMQHWSETVANRLAGWTSGQQKAQ
ncbi:MAG: hypothetical protein RLZZ09_3120 [Pseudomonadota bacterium]|jgi:hypothetical protein